MSSERSEMRMLKGVCGSAKHGANGFQTKGKQAAGRVASSLVDRAGHLADGGDEQRAKRGANAEGSLRECEARSKRLSTKGPGHLENGKQIKENKRRKP